MSIVSTINLNDYPNIATNITSSIFVYEYNNVVTLFMTNKGSNSVIEANITNNIDLTNTNIDFKYFLSPTNNLGINFPWSIAGDTQNNLYLSYLPNGSNGTIAKIPISDIYASDLNIWGSTNPAFFSNLFYFEFNLYTNNQGVNSILEKIASDLPTNTSVNLFTNQLLQGSYSFTFCNNFCYAISPTNLSIAISTTNNNFEISWFPFNNVNSIYYFNNIIIGYTSSQMNCLFIINLTDNCISQLKITDNIDSNGFPIPGEFTNNWSGTLSLLPVTLCIHDNFLYVLCKENSNYSIIVINITAHPPPPPKPEPSPIPIFNICFRVDTLVTTDQGNIPISKINPNYHTIRKQQIVAVTTTTTTDKFLVCIKKHALGFNIPNRDTVMTRGHKIWYRGYLMEAYKFLRFRNVRVVKYHGKILYNILMKSHKLIKVHNMFCETLHPNNVIAKLFRKKLDKKILNKTVVKLNRNIKSNNYTQYKKILRKL